MHFDGWGMLRGEEPIGHWHCHTNHGESFWRGAVLIRGVYAKYKCVSCGWPRCTRCLPNSANTSELVTRRADTRVHTIEPRQRSQEEIPQHHPLKCLYCIELDRQRGQEASSSTTHLEHRPNDDDRRPTLIDNRGPDERDFNLTINGTEARAGTTAQSISSDCDDTNTDYSPDHTQTLIPDY